MAAPAPVLVREWGEGRHEKALPVLRVLVDGQHVGSIYIEDGTWHASAARAAHHRETVTDHPDAAAALRAVLRSRLARQLGARVTSRVHATPRARRQLGG